MTLALVRHGHRAFSGAEGNEGLSPKGLNQAEKISQLLHQRLRSRSVHVLSSPKRRCLETATPIARVFKKTPTTEANLEECRGFESLSDLETRVAEFFIELRAGAWGDCVIAVSHSDWLELAGALLLGSRPELRWGHATVHLIELGRTGTSWLETF